MEPHSKIVIQTHIKTNPKFTHVEICFQKLIKNTLQVTVQDWDGRTYVAYYQSIVIGSEDDKYALSLSGYDNVNSTLADAFAGGGNVGASFTTWDSDNDAWATDNCGKAWWSGKYSCNYHIQNQLYQKPINLNLEQCFITQVGGLVAVEHRTSMG